MVSARKGEILLNFVTLLMLYWRRGVWESFAFYPARGWLWGSIATGETWFFSTLCVKLRVRMMGGQRILIELAEIYLLFSLTRTLKLADTALSHHWTRKTLGLIDDLKWRFQKPSKKRWTTHPSTTPGERLLGLVLG